MKFATIEKDIDKRLETLIKVDSQNSLGNTQLCGYFDGAMEQAIIFALRRNEVMMNDFLKTALWEWEYLLNKMVDRLPAYVKENLICNDGKEKLGE